MSTHSTLLGEDLLAPLGFVNVTGLPVMKMAGARLTDGGQISSSALGCWNVDAGLLVVVTTNGVVWLASAKALNEGGAMDIIESLCPNGQAGTVPCADGAIISHGFVLRRLLNPSDNFLGACLPVPLVVPVSPPAS
ncbi:MAG: hypothetical protein AAB511_00945 [Patescibacteria group bacterium]